MRRKSGCRLHVFIFIEVMEMYKIGDIVIYGTEGLCKIVDITEKKFGKEVIEYYVLEPVDSAASTTYVPLKNEKSLSKMRHILKEEEILEIIKELPSDEIQWIASDRERRQVFRDIILFGDSKDIIKLARTIHLHQKELSSKGRKLHIADERFLKDAERMIFDEIAYVMHIDKGEVIDFITENINNA